VALVVPSSQEIKLSDKVPHKIYQVPYKPGFAEETFVPLELEGNKIQLLTKMSEVLAVLCESALSSTKILKELEGFDLILYDTDVCAALVGEVLGIPRVELVTNAPNVPFIFPHMIPMPVSYVPQLLTGLTDKMTFVERVLNLGAYLGGQLFMHIVFARPMNALKVKYNIKPKRSFQETVGDAEMVIITADFALEYPQPLLPGIKSNRSIRCIILFVPT